MATKEQFVQLAGGEKRKYFVKLPQMHDDKILLWFESSYQAKTAEWFRDLWAKLEKLQGRKLRESEAVGIRCFGMYKTESKSSTWRFIDNMLPDFMYDRFK